VAAPGGKEEWSWWLGFPGASRRDKGKEGAGGRTTVMEASTPCACSRFPARTNGKGEGGGRRGTGQVVWAEAGLDRVGPEGKEREGERLGRRGKVGWAAAGDDRGRGPGQVRVRWLGFSFYF
jgi:hypothetical protein